MMNSVLSLLQGLEVMAVFGYSYSYLLTQIFNGISLGLIFVLISIGLSIIFGLLGIVNFAHGEFLLVGAYVAWATTTVTGNIFIGFLAATVIVALMSLVIEHFLLRRTYDYNVLLQLLLTFGLAEVIRELVQIIWGRSGETFPIPDWASGSANLIAFNYPLYRLFVIVTAGAMVVLVYWFLTNTNYGLLISAGTQDRQMVNALGIDISKIFTLVFVLASGIVGFAGGLIAPIRGVYPLLGVELLIPAFVVVVIGGMGSFRGSVVAGLLVGEVVVLTSVIASTLSNVVIFLLMAVVLLLRPRGLWGREGVVEH